MAHQPLERVHRAHVQIAVQIDEQRRLEAMMPCERVGERLIVEALDKGRLVGDSLPDQLA